MAPKKRIDKVYPLSPMQSGMLFHALKNEKSRAYFQQNVLKIKGEIDRDLLQQSFDLLFERYDILRTVFRMDKLEEPLQFVLKKRDFKLDYKNISGLNKDKQDAVIEEFTREDIGKGFDLARDILMRAVLFKIGLNTYTLVWSFHHILMDGWCLGIIYRELVRVYRRLQKGKPGTAALEPVTPYIEYIQWLEKQDREEGLSYWEKYLEGYDLQAGLPRLETVDPVKEEKYKPGEYTPELDEKETSGLNEIARESRVTLNTVLQTLWGILLQKYNNTDDVVFGVVVSGRSAGIHGIENMVGLFINTIPLRITTGERDSLKEILKRVHQDTMASRPFEYLSLAEVQMKSLLKGDLIHHIMLFQNYPLDKEMKKESMKPGNDFCIEDIHVREQSNYNFNIVIVPGERFRVIFNYNLLEYGNLFIKNIGQHFKQVIRQVLHNPFKPVKEIDILTPAEKHQVLFDFNRTEADYPKNKTLHALFEEQVKRTPDNITVAGPLPMKYRTYMTYKTYITYISYRELNEQGNHLALLLRQKGVKTDTVVGIMVGRSIEMIIGLLGILKAGGAYLPIDPGYPQERIKYMLKDSNAGVLVTTPKLQVKVKIEVEENDRQPGLPLQFIHIHTDPAIASEASLSTLTSTSTCQVSPTNLAYIIYTSGSTGKPRGVLVEHKNVVRLVKNSNYIHGEKGDKLLPTGSVVFDISTFEIWWPLLNGLALVLADEDTILDAEQLEETLVKNNVTILHLVPQLFNQMAAQHPKLFGHIKYFLVGGDVVSPEYINRIRSKYPGLKILHMYGPTENTTFSTFFPVEREFEGGIPIGKPISNSTVYILDRNSRLQPIGAAGELCVGGEGLARGYLNHPQLTAEKFDQDFWDLQDYHDKRKEVPGKKNYMSHRSYIYRTGDLARWLSDGNIEFLGRIDHQVKIRGFRIELGEIENRLLKHDMVNEAAVVMKSQRLCAYMVLNGSSAPPSQTPLVSSISRELKKYLAQYLPGYMIPAYFIQQQAMPLNPNGKIDRKALPEPEIDAGEHYTAPGNKVERRLVEIWAGILDRKTGIDDNFFEIGGHSLNAAVLISKIQKEFNVKLSLTEFFRTPFIRETAEYIIRAAGEEYIPPEPVEKKEYYPLSSAQQRLYILQQVETEGIGYNMPTAVSLEGALDRERLEETFRELIHRHESLRTSFHMIDNEAVQKIHPEVEFGIVYYDLTAKNAKEHEDTIKNFIKPFDLSRIPLLRVGLIHLHTPPFGHPSQEGRAQKYILMLDIHHIIFDGTSMGLLVREFMDLYAGKNLPGLRIRYKDYSQWQRFEKQLTALKKQKDYWLGQLSGELPVLALPTDYPRPLVQSFAGRTITFELDKTVTVMLKERARQADVTLFMILLAVFNVFLSKLSGQEDILVGIPVTARRHEDWQYIIGMFVNTLASRNRPIGEKPFIDFLDQLKTQVLADFENQEYQFEDLVENLEINRDTGRNPVFDVMFAFQNINIPTLEIPGLKLEPYDFDIEVSKFDLLLEALEKGEAIFFRWQYCVSLFKQETIERFIVYFKTIVSAIIQNPGQAVSCIEVISEEERQRVLVDFNDTSASYPKDKTLHQLIEEQGEKIPNHVALVGQSASEERSAPCAGCHAVSYRELNRKANQLANLLKEKDVKPDTIVGIMVERSLEMVIGILGILKAGGAYMPIDPEYPRDRIDFMLKDSSAKILLTAPDLTSNFDPSPSTLTSTCQVSPTNLAYTIYTSGTTGRPKGVMVIQRNVIRLVKQTNYIEFNKADRVLQTGALEFDASTFEIWGALLNGLTLYLVSKDKLLTPGALKEAVDKYDICTMWLTSPLFNQMLQADIGIFKGLGNLLVGGDVLSPVYIHRLRRRYKDLNIINGYGPTENTTFSTTYSITREHMGNIPIGKPVANSTVYIINKYNKLQPIGVAGELCVGGDGVSRGYLNDPELTAEKFFYRFNRSYRSYKSYISKNIYKTGDLACWLPDGNIEFLGRRDHQVKIRGYRIEPEEIESLLLRHDTVKDAVVFVIEKDKEKYVCAYIVSDSEPAPSGLRHYLAELLPAYMIPSYFTQLEQIPLTPNGKVDRKALPVPGFETGDYAAPRNKIEETLAGIWSEVLNISTIGIDDNFFDLGGHSLKATSLTSKIHKEFNVRLSLSEFFRAPYIRQIAEYIQKSAGEKYIPPEPVEEKAYYRLSSAHKRLYVLQELESDSISYNMCAVFSVEGESDKERFEETFQKLIQRHESFRTSFHMMDNEPVQRIHEKVEFEIEYYETGKRQKAKGNKEELMPNAYCLMPESLIKSFIRPFDLSRAPLLRVGLSGHPRRGTYISQGGRAQKYILIVDMHHIISDGASMGVLIADFMAIYSGNKLPELPVHYKDYTEWQEKTKGGQFMKQQEEYWLNELQGELVELNLPHDFPRPEIRQFKGQRLEFEIPQHQADALKQLALEQETTLYVVLLALVNIFLAKLSGQEDIIVGTAVANRRHADLEHIIGMFVNTLVLKNYPKADLTVIEFLKQVKDSTIKAHENQEYPFDDLVEKIAGKKTRDAARNPLFDVVFALQNMEIPEVQIPGLKLSPYTFETGISKFDLMLSGFEERKKLKVQFIYSSNLFRKQTVQRFIRYFQEVMESVLENKQIKILDIEISHGLREPEAAIFHEARQDFSF